MVPDPGVFLTCFQWGAPPAGRAQEKESPALIFCVTENENHGQSPPPGTVVRMEQAKFKAGPWHI